MTEAHRLTRRTFIVDLGRGLLAIAVLGPGAAACSTSRGATSTIGGAASSTTAGPVTTTAVDPTATTATTGLVAGGLRLGRVDLGFVSAYVLARGTEAAIVDTGVAGSEGEILVGLTEIGLGWGDVGHVILTDLHPDHIGSAQVVMTAAGQATGYAGAADIPAIPAPRPLTAVGDGDTVFGLDVIATPGHTAGHISVLDLAAGILVAGDALTGENGGVAGPNPQFSTDHATAMASVGKLATFTYETVVFGHGEPVDAGGSELVAALAAGL